MKKIPYIKQKLRPKFDKIVSELIRDDLNLRSELIYILFEFCKQHIKPSYNNYKNFCGELRQCAIEIERREQFFRTIDIIVNKICESRKIICNRKIEIMKNADIKVNGDLNYILYSLCKRYKSSIFAKTYNHKNLYYKIYCRNLRIIVKRIETEILAPHEDQKIKKNGDV